MVSWVAYAAMGATTMTDLEAGFRHVPREARMRMYWRVFGPAWTPDEMDVELDQVKRAGVGGVVVYFMYPLAVDDPSQGIKNLRFGSPEFLESFRYASTAAAQRGLRFGVNGSTGWPYGGPTVSLADSAQHIREEADPAKPLAEGERVVWAAGTKRYISGPTRMNVKRPAFGGEGLVVSHYDTPAFERYLRDVIEPMTQTGDERVRQLGCDSLEVYGSNWTDDLPAVFKARRGYDLLPHLPELFDADSQDGRAIRFDFWRTLAELTEERFTKPLGDWCAKHGIELEMEPYGTPPNPMTASRSIQVPTGEHYEWKGFSVQKYVASAAHQAGRRVVGSEAWTWSGLPNRLADSLSDLKLVSDMTFLSGANDLTAVDFPYSPRSAGTPGWTPYYGPFMGPGNAQWPMFPTLVDYCNRCQWLLRQGDPVRKVAVYLPVEDCFREGPADQMLLDFYVRDRLVTGKATSEFGLQNGLKHQSDLVHQLVSNGLDYDGIDFWTVDRVARVTGKTLAVGPARYEALVLPHLATMDLDALRKVAAFCRAGGRLVVSGQGPTLAPGRSDPRAAQEFAHIVTDLFGGHVPGEWHACGKGSVLLVAKDKEVGPALAGVVQPSVRYAARPATVGFQHRRTADADIFFLANVGPDKVALDLDFATSHRARESWDALTGEIRQLPKGGPAHLTIPPRGSIFVVAGPPPSHARPARRAPAHVERVNIDGPWTLTFEGPDAPNQTAAAVLGSWTAIPQAKFFSGLGHYRTSIDWTPRSVGRVVLELGDVREAARVQVNGKLVGTCIVPPFEVEVTDALKPGANTVEVTVANLPVNRFIGQPRPDLTALRRAYGARFSAPEEHDLMKGVPAPSGLLGPVRFRLERRSD